MTSHLMGGVAAAAMLTAMAIAAAPVACRAGSGELFEEPCPGLSRCGRRIHADSRLQGCRGRQPPSNTAAFLRLRAASDGEDPKPANAVIIAMPGFSSTPPHWLWLSTQLVHKANERTCDDGKSCRVEVWIIERREAPTSADTAGLREAWGCRADPKIALDPYA